MMFKLLLAFVLITLSMGQYKRPLVFHPHPDNYFQFSPLISYYGQRVQNVQLCTYSEISYEKCIHAVAVAHNNSIPFNLNCVRQNSRQDCIDSVQSGVSDMVVLTGHGYKPARNAGLRPLIFAKEDDESLYIAVAPRNITFLALQETPIYFDHSIDRAFHAATYFNLRMGHDICSFLDKTSMTSYISIVDSATYKPTSEEILICPNRVPDEFKNYKRCNVEAGLQRAVFVRWNISSKKEQDVLKILETIIQHFDAESVVFKFFDKFQDHDDVIFKKNTISFDLWPSYRNEVDEHIYNELHCNKDDQSHDHRVLL